MQEERMKILQMVAEGKISADEAETLLRSLGNKQQHNQRNRQQRREHRRGPRIPRPPKPPKAPRMGQFTHDIDNFTQGVERFVEGFVEGTVSNVVEGITKSMKDNFDHEFEKFDRAFDRSPSNISVEPNTTLDIKHDSGTLTLLSTDEPIVKISGALQHHYQLHKKNNRIEVHNKHFETDLTIHIPREITQLNIRTEISSIMAMGLTHIPRDLQISSEVGSVDLNLGLITEGRILVKTETGSINISLSEKSAFDLKALGQIDTRIHLDHIEQDPAYLGGSLNGGGAKIRLISPRGKIKIEPLEAPEANHSPTTANQDIDIDIDIT